MLLLASSVCGLFKRHQFEPEVILLAVGWYLRFSLYRDVEELLAERGLHADHVTVWRWVQRYAPEMERRLRSRLRPTNDSWRVDETYIRVKGKWVYLYRAVDSTGATVDFLLSAKRDAAAAERFLAKALGGENHPAPRVINTDEHAGYPSAIVRLKAQDALEENCRHRPVQYLNNILEQDHRAIKCRVRASQHFRSFWGAWRTIAGYKAIQTLQRAAQAEELVANYETRLERLRSRTVAQPEHPRVAILEWLDPPMAAGNWTPELVEYAGGINLFGEVGVHSSWLAWEDLLAADPDVIILTPCGFTLERTLQDVPLLEARQRWSSLRAVRNGRVFAIDGKQYFNRSGPRLVESAEILASLLFAKDVADGIDHTSWQNIAEK